MFFNGLTQPIPALGAGVTIASVRLVLQINVHHVPCDLRQVLTSNATRGKLEIFFLALG